MTLMVTIVEGIAGAAVSEAKKKTISNRGGVFIEMSVLATREVGLVGSITIVREPGLIITLRPVVVRAQDTTRMDTGSVVGLG